MAHSPQTVRTSSSGTPESRAETAARDLNARIAKTGAIEGWTGSAWQSCLCFLVLMLKPVCKIHTLVSALPYRTSVDDVDTFLNAMVNLGYRADFRSGSIEKITFLEMPCLFIPEGQEENPLVILSYGQYFDGRNGRIKDVSDRMCGKIWTFTAYQDIDSSTSKATRKNTKKSWFSATLERFKGIYAQVLVIGLMLNLVALAAPLFIMMVYDRVISAHQSDMLLILSIGVGIALIAEWILRKTQTSILSSFSSRLDNIVSNQIFGRLVSLSPGYIERASVPAQVARLKTFESVRDFFSGSVFLSVLEAPFIIIALGVIGLIAGPLAFVPVAAAAIYTILFLIIWRHVKVAIRIAAKAMSARQQFTLETFEKLHTIRTFGMTATWQKKFQDLSEQESLSHFKLNWLGYMGETLAHGLTVLSSVAIVGFGAHLIWAGEATAGALVATMILSWRVLTPFYSLCTMIPRLDQIRNSIRQVNDLMDIEPEKSGKERAINIGHIKGEVSFSNVGLRYPGATNPLLSGLSFKLDPGGLCIISGENGTGKTTLLKMVIGMYMPQLGSIHIDGHDIRQIDPHEWRRRIAYIPQYPQLFQGTIEENLRMCNPLASRMEIEFALRQAGIWDDIGALPQGTETMIGGDSPVHISSGLAHKLCIVRAFLQDAPVLLADELPNSIMNSAAGRFLKENILKNRAERTVIMVSFREDYMEMADQIVVLRHRAAPMAGSGRKVLEKLHELNW